MAFAYGDTYIANSDLQDGLMIENQAMLNAGFKTGDKIIAADGKKLPNLTMTST
jgi:regulator of sigma E protease